MTLDVTIKIVVGMKVTAFEKTTRAKNGNITLNLIARQKTMEIVIT